MRLLFSIGSLIVSIGSLLLWHLLRKDTQGYKPAKIFANWYFGFLFLIGLAMSLFWFVEWIKA